ncbi:unnamed protein product [Arctia plantaginis]|uniref:DUF7041 domain-containing protein n=1 Tax=Arctia plantaginis TaxID=874455 RepID=A0A8S1B8P2_ARCPL|nr:unnamed protein product [Arctia plantaginis]
MTTNPPSPPQVEKVAIKLPSFWIERPAVWFAQAEAQFDLAGVTTDSTKYNHVLSTIDQRLIGEVEDIILNPPATNKYTTLKEQLIQRLSTSEEERVRRLLSEEELGDRKPSSFLRHLRSLAGMSSKDDKLLRQLFLRRLPNNVQAILAAQADLTLDKISELADRIMDLPSSPQVHSLDNTSPTLSSLATCVEQLTKQVSALMSQQQHHRSRSRGPSNHRGRSRSRTPGPSGAKFCWYHRRFAARAAKCIQPCSWTVSGNQQGNQ